ncbi:hypothetical protein [Kocuria sabuli]|uniref:hypothetical protein n=1 Tax=Kocuria sabuli TaxID=3071448 RepID=UPI0034D6AC98
MTDRPGTCPRTRPAVNWLLVLGLGALPLLQGLVRHLDLPALIGAPAAAAMLTVLVTVAWVAVVGWGRVPRPVATLTLAGLTAGIYTIVLSAVLSPLITGTLQGPLAFPLAIVPVLLVPTVWGLMAGLIALALQHLRKAPR